MNTVGSPYSVADGESGQFNYDLSKRVVDSLKNLNNSLQEVRKSVARIDHIANSRLNQPLSTTSASFDSGVSSPIPSIKLSSIASSPVIVNEDNSLVSVSTKETSSIPYQTASVTFNVDTLPNHDNTSEQSAISIIKQLLLSPALRGSGLDESLLSKCSFLSEGELKNVREHVSFRPSVHHEIQTDLPSPTAKDDRPDDVMSIRSVPATPQSVFRGSRPHTPPPSNWHPHPSRHTEAEHSQSLRPLSTHSVGRQSVRSQGSVRFADEESFESRGSSDDEDDVTRTGFSSPVADVRSSSNSVSSPLACESDDSQESDSDLDFDEPGVLSNRDVLKSVKKAVNGGNVEEAIELLKALQITPDNNKSAAISAVVSAPISAPPPLPPSTTSTNVIVEEVKLVGENLADFNPYLDFGPINDDGNLPVQVLDPTKPVPVFSFARYDENHTRLTSSKKFFLPNSALAWETKISELISRHNENLPDGVPPIDTSDLGVLSSLPLLEDEMQALLSESDLPAGPAPGSVLMERNIPFHLYAFEDVDDFKRYNDLASLRRERERTARAQAALPTEQLLAAQADSDAAELLSSSLEKFEAELEARSCAEFQPSLLHAGSSTIPAGSLPEDPFTVVDDGVQPAVSSVSVGDAPWPQVSSENSATGRVDAFSLRVVFENGRTGSEGSRELRVARNDVLAGRFRVDELMGSAMFSSALSCRDLVTGEDVCLKVIKNDKGYLDQSLDEIRLLRYLNSQGDPDLHHVLRLLGYFYYKEHLILVTELLKDNLYEFQKYLSVNSLPSYYTLPRIQRIAKQVLKALAFVHAKGLIHCDLKPENILIKSYSRCEVKVIDFGASCFLNDHLTSYIQSRSYRAPEVSLGMPYDARIDIWSLGCILAELYMGVELFVNHSLQWMLVRMQSILGPFPRHMVEGSQNGHLYFTGRGDGTVYEMSEKGVNIYTPVPTTLAEFLHCNDPLFLDFLSAMLTLDPAKRPTAHQLLKHPWMLDENELPCELYTMPSF